MVIVAFVERLRGVRAGGYDFAVPDVANDGRHAVRSLECRTHLEGALTIRVSIHIPSFVYGLSLTAGRNGTRRSHR